MNSVRKQNYCIVIYHISWKIEWRLGHPGVELLQVMALLAVQPRVASHGFVLVNADWKGWKNVRGVKTGE